MHMKNALFRFVSAVRTNTIIGALFALPGIGLAFYFSPNDVGYLLISTVAMVLYVSAQRVNQEEEVGSEIEEIPENKRGFFVSLLILSTFIMVTAQLSTVLILAQFLTGGSALLVIPIAVFFPLIDRRIAEHHLLFSIGGITAMVIVRLFVFVSNYITSPSRDSYISEEIREVGTLY
ncbi:hypothetical protein [Halorussus caseinilyticus]|uniref:Uncharacterized protein n=1 Tax=Halorussus caseinilyticus TaxID=3034025 RepID=A0ABD5WMF5_9EURY|nr:hypothetical protein [Halorussus sp. DT72]